MKFSIITPSFRNSEWLKLCIASVADQQGVELEHLVQDSCSDDGTQDWLPHEPRVKAFIEKDRGMYDAINRGLRRASGEIFAYLNCDEQYLPGALATVHKAFESHPETDMVFGDVVVVDEHGAYRFHRKMLTPSLAHTWVDHLATLTCATFFRRRIIDDYQIFFDEHFRIVGDGEWMVRVIQRGVKMMVLRKFTSAFTDTGRNLTSNPDADHEYRKRRALAPAWMRIFRPGIVALHRVRRLLGGIYFQKPFSYELYRRQNPAQRARVEVSNPRFRWRLTGPARVAL